MSALDSSELRTLYDLSEAADVGLRFEEFTRQLAAVAARFLPADASSAQKVGFYRKLHLKDFALARACSGGSAVAWECFVARFRGRLYAVAVAVARNEPVARELSESLVGDLFVSGGGKSKLASYSGRGSLDGWLKALVTHAYVDRYRSERRWVSLEDRIDILRTSCVGDDGNLSEADPRLNVAIHDAFFQRAPEDRFLLAAYFFDGSTLAEIAGVLGVHEASVSRRLHRVLADLRKSIRHHLQKNGMSLRQIDESLRSEQVELSVDVRGLLFRGLAGE